MRGLGFLLDEKMMEEQIMGLKVKLKSEKK